MSNDDFDEYFVDGITNVSHVNGVFRVTFGQQETEGSSRSTVKIMIPGSQIAPVIKSLTGAVNSIASKIKENTEKSAKQKNPATKIKKPKKKK